MMAQRLAFTQGTRRIPLVVLHCGLIVQVIHRVNRCTVDENLVVEVGTGSPPRHPDGADELTPTHLLPHHDVEGAEVAIFGGKAIPMVNQGFVPIA